MRLMITPHATEPCSQKPCTTRTRPPPAPLLLGAVVDSIPQTYLRCRLRADIWGRGFDWQAAGYPRVSRQACRGRGGNAGDGASAIGAYIRAVHAASAMALRVAPAPPFRTAPARSPPGGNGQRPRRDGGTEKKTSSAVTPSRRGMTTAVPRSSSSGLPTRGKGLPHS